MNDTSQNLLPSKAIDEKEDPSERFKRIMVEGKQIEATSPFININHQPDYYNEERFQRAQTACQKYYTNISLASNSGLILLMQIESILVPLLKTGKSRTVVDLYNRYIATAKYIRKCYETNFHEPTSEGWKGISLVRVMHERIHKFMKEDPSAKQVAPNVWVNQYDMAITQWAFIGLFLLRPDKCGAYHITRQELADITYYWRLISYYFGIEERFNIFVYENNFDKQIEMMNILLEHYNQLMRESRMEIGTRMAEGLMLAFEGFNTEASFNILDHWWSPFVSLSGKSELTPYTMSEKWKVIFFHFYFKVLFRSETMLGIINNMYKKKFDKFVAEGEKNKLKLAKKYNYTYELEE